MYSSSRRGALLPLRRGGSVQYAAVFRQYPAHKTLWRRQSRTAGSNGCKHPAEAGDGSSPDVCGSIQALRDNIGSTAEAQRILFADTAEEMHIQAEYFRGTVDKGGKSPCTDACGILRNCGIRSHGRQTGSERGFSRGKRPVSHGCISGAVAVAEAQLYSRALSYGAISKADSLSGNDILGRLHERQKKRTAADFGSISASDAHRSRTSLRTDQADDRFFAEYRHFYQGGRIP